MDKLLGYLGLIAMIIGFYFIIFSPSNGFAFYNVGNVAINEHDMFFGQTLAIIGAIFVAVQWRPC